MQRLCRRPDPRLAFGGQWLRLQPLPSRLSACPASWPAVCAPLWPLASARWLMLLVGIVRLSNWPVSSVLAGSECSSWVLAAGLSQGVKSLTSPGRQVRVRVPAAGTANQDAGTSVHLQDVVVVDPLAALQLRPHLQGCALPAPADGRWGSRLCPGKRARWFC